MLSLMKAYKKERTLEKIKLEDVSLKDVIVVSEEIFCLKLINSLQQTSHSH